MSEATTHVFPVKCMACSLHYKVFTWSEDWPEEQKNFCPECGSTGPKLIWHEQIEEFIFSQVPGPADLVALS